MIYLLAKHEPTTRATILEWDEHGSPEAWGIERVMVRWEAPEGRDYGLYVEEEDRPFGIPVEKIVVVD